MGLADPLMAGRLGASSLAAVAVGNSVWMLNFTACLGVLMAISPHRVHAYWHTSQQDLESYDDWDELR